MDQRKSYLAGIMGLFEKQIDMRTYNSRLILQKLVYLIQCKGIDFDYAFGWYLRGPYSAALAADGFFLSEKGGFTATIPENGEEVVDLIKSALGEDIKDGNKMEIIASLLFLKNESKFLDDTSLVAMLLGRKPWLDVREIEVNLKKLKVICPEAFTK